MFNLLLCRCGCGRATAKHRPQPGAVPPKFFGYIAGHEPVTRGLITAEEMEARRKAKFLINAAEVGGLLEARR